MSHFTLGQIVYDKWGRRGEYVGTTKEGHYIRPISTVGGFDDEYEFTENHAELVPEVFEKAPMPRWSLAVLTIVLVVVVGLWLA